MFAEEIKALVQQHVNAFSAGNDEEAISVFAPDVIYHNPPTEIHGREGMRELFAMYRQGFPEIMETIENLIVENDMAAFSYSCRGLNKGEMMGFPPTHKEITFCGIVICRIENGKMTEIWEQIDTLGLLEQLAAVARLSPPNAKPATASL
jgi:steroid delta-isomerase-like uncharacterized protein